MPTSGIKQQENTRVEGDSAAVKINMDYKQFLNKISEPLDCQPAEKKTKKAMTQSSPIKFTYKDLYRCLYRQNGIEALNTMLIKQNGLPTASKAQATYWCEICREDCDTECPIHGPKHSLKRPDKVEKQKVTNAIKSFPEEVELCRSSIPGAGYGVCTKRAIPLGTWIGPYEGRRLSAQEIVPGQDTSYMWEIYKDGVLASYIDGTDENTSSWMRFIRCARNKEEQNLFAFQYLENIYYRAFREIPIGKELLVWYDDKYPHYLGMPESMFDMSSFIPNGSKPSNDTMVVIAPREIPSTPSPQKNGHPLPNNSTLPPTHPAGIKRSYSNGPSSTELLGDQPRMIPVVDPAVAHVNGWQQQQLKPQGIAAKKVDIRAAHAVHQSPPRRYSTSDCHSPLVRKTSESGSSYAPSSDEEKSPSPVSPRSPDASEVSCMWKCGQCGKTFAQRAMLQIHVCPRTPRKPYQCGHCPDSFCSPNELRTHVVTHMGEKPFKCGYCSRSFSGSTTLNNHIRTHTGEKPFQCDKCDKNFSQASQLSRHQRIPGDCIESK